VALENSHTESAACADAAAVPTSLLPEETYGYSLPHYHPASPSQRGTGWVAYLSPAQAATHARGSFLQFAVTSRVPLGSRDYLWWARARYPKTRIKQSKNSTGERRAGDKSSSEGRGQKAWW